MSHIDYVSPADRIGTSLDAKRARAIVYLRSRDKYILDLDCDFNPTDSHNTDIETTMVMAHVEMAIEECAAYAAYIASIMRRQVA